MNTRRIAARAGSMLSTLNSGITFAHTVTSSRASERDGVVGGVAISGEHDRARERALAERRGVVQQHLAVAAVGAAGEQQDVGRERDDALDVGAR